jgi:hypothetical protein
MFQVSSMKKSHIILAAVPVVCAVGGFGLGQLLHSDAPAEMVEHAPVHNTAAEGILHSLAGDAAKTGGTNTPEHSAKPDAHAKPKHEEKHSAVMPVARIMPASYTPDATPDMGQNRQAATKVVDHGKAPVPAHRLDPDKLAAHAHEVQMEKTKVEREKARDKKLAEIESKVETSTRNPALLPVDVEARIAEDAIKRIAASEEHVVKLGRITLPVKGAAKTTYYVADFGIAVTNMDHAAYYYTGENAARLRDQVMLTLHELAPTQLLRSDLVDSEVLADRVTEDLQDKFDGISKLIFLSLYKTDIPLS